MTKTVRFSLNSSPRRGNHPPLTRARAYRPAWMNQSADDQEPIPPMPLLSNSPPTSSPSSSDASSTRAQHGSPSPRSNLSANAKEFIPRSPSNQSISPSYSSASPQYSPASPDSPDSLNSSPDIKKEPEENEDPRTDNRPIRGSAQTGSSQTPPWLERSEADWIRFKGMVEEVTQSKLQPVLAEISKLYALLNHSNMLLINSVQARSAIRSQLTTVLREQAKIPKMQTHRDADRARTAIQNTVAETRNLLRRSAPLVSTIQSVTTQACSRCNLRVAQVRAASCPERCFICATCLSEADRSGVARRCPLHPNRGIGRFSFL